jgi:hypothetical protein
MSPPSCGFYRLILTRILYHVRLYFPSIFALSADMGKSILQTAEKLGGMQATNFKDETPMEYAYRADTWQALYAAVAGSAAALTGLLFIGLSLNLRIIVEPAARQKSLMS